MPRIARTVAIGFPHHIVQRGNNREKIFFAQETRKKYLDLLKEHARKWDVHILAYCLMTNHVHFLVRPDKVESLGKMMQGLNVSYTRYINKRYKRTGRIFEGRYHSCIVDEEAYLWSVVRYIEQNPTRAKMVKKLEDYPYSSALAHLSGRKDEVLTEELFSAPERLGYIEFMRGEIPSKEQDNIRLSTRRGRPLGDDKFISKIERMLNAILRPKATGRPVK